MKKVLLAVFLFASTLFACAHVPRNSPRRAPVVLHVPENYEHDLQAKIDLAIALLPVSIKEIRHDLIPHYDSGVIHVAFWPENELPPNALGYTEYVGPCQTWIIIRDNGDDTEATLAHELGHALGLEHVWQTDNLMYPIGIEGRVDLTRQQRNRAVAVASALAYCRAE